MTVNEYENAADEELVRLSAGGDTGATDVLLRRYKKIVTGAARFYYMKGAERDDVIQEGMIGLFEAIRDYKPSEGTDFKHFAELCVTRQILNAVSHAGRKKHRILNESLSLDDRMPDSGGSPAQNVGDTVPADRIYEPEPQAMASVTLAKIKELAESMLSPLEREVWDLMISGYDTAEIAGMTGRSRKSVDNAVQRIKRKIHKYLE
ncbi:MAG: sigma-70 family RNA polymerase sigma factor [Anaerovoracaceae bacterium]